MRVLVTGASGFIGRALCKRLVAQGAEVYGAGIHSRHPMLAREVHYIEADVTDPKAIQDIEVELVYHLAAKPDVWYAQLHPAEVFQINVGGTLQMLELARKLDARFVLTSSIALYSGEGAPFSEEQVAPRSFLAIGARCAELYCEQYSDAFLLQCVVLRLGYVYGPECRGPVSDIRKGGPLYMNAETVLDFVHVDDVTEALLKAGQHHRFGVFNISAGTGTTVRELIDLLGGAVEPNNEKPILTLVMDPSRAKRELGWEAAIGLKEGLCNG